MLSSFVIIFATRIREPKANHPIVGNKTPQVNPKEKEWEDRQTYFYAPIAKDKFFFSFL